LHHVTNPSTLGLGGWSQVHLVEHETPQLEQRLGVGRRLLDVFDDGRVLTPDQADALIMDLSGELPDRDAWAPATPRATILRMLNNLCASAAAQRDDDRLLRYLDAALAVDPDAASQRLQRLLVHAKNGRRTEALADAAWIMEHQPQGIDLDRLRDLTNTLEQRP
jgi:regulator of sirC expression with transglutaminase-like and TPR domain